MQGITGRKIRVLGQASVTVSSTSNHPIAITVAVIPDNYLRPSALLGMNAISQATLTLDYQARKFY